MNDSTCIARAATLTGFTSAVSSTNGIQLRELPPMTTLLVRTRNSRYHIVVSSGDEVLVKGGHFFPALTEARFSGASVGGSFLKLAGLAWDFGWRSSPRGVGSSPRPCTTSSPER